MIVLIHLATQEKLSAYCSMKYREMNCKIRKPLLLAAMTVPILMPISLSAGAPSDTQDREPSIILQSSDLCPKLIEQTKNGITASCLGITVRGLTQLLQEQSDVKFFTSPSLLEQEISVKAEGKNWTALILEIFKNFNNVLLWNENMQLNAVYLLGQGVDPDTGLDSNDNPSLFPPGIFSAEPIPRYQPPGAAITRPETTDISQDGPPVDEIIEDAMEPPPEFELNSHPSEP